MKPLLIWSALYLVTGIAPAAYCQWLEIEADGLPFWFDSPVSGGCAYSAWGRVYVGRTTPSSPAVLRTPAGDTPFPAQPDWWYAEFTARHRAEFWSEQAICWTGAGWRDSFTLSSWSLSNVPGCDASCWAPTGEFSLSAVETDYTPGDHWPLHPTVPGPILPPATTYTFTIDAPVVAHGSIGGFDLGTIDPTDATVTVTVTPTGWSVYIGPPFRAGDFNRNGSVDASDIFAFLAAWFAGERRADRDGDGHCGLADLTSFLGDWFAN